MRDQTQDQVFDISRRRFIQAVGIAGVYAISTQLITPSRAIAAIGGEPSSTKQAVNLFVAFDHEGTVEITCHRSDMGQQIRTAIGQIIADEMEADWSRVRIAQALGDARYGDQNTDGSRSIRYNFERLRRLGASVRKMLADAAGQYWAVPSTECVVADHKIIHAKSGQQLDFRDVIGLLATVKVPDDAELSLKSQDQWRYINTAMATVDMKALITGRALFGADVRLPDTKVAVVARPPVVLGKVTSFDAKAALAIPGVLKVIKIPAPSEPLVYQPLGGVAVIATNTWAAIQGRKALKIEWAAGDNGTYDSAAYQKRLEQQTRQPGKIVRSQGNIETGLASAATRLDAEYYVPHLSHAPMEPPVATARLTADGVEVWAATQNPQADQAEVARMLGLQPAQIQVHVTLLGGAFGRKSKPDFSSEAAYLAQQSGFTIRLQWTREDDIQHDFYHTVSAQKLTAGLDDQGRIVAFRHRTVFPSIGALFALNQTGPSGGELSQGFTDSPINAPNLQLEVGEAQAHVRIGWLRSVNNIHHSFAVQSFIAEMAAAAQRDPKDYLLEVIGPARHLTFEGMGDPYPNYGEPLTRYPYDTGRLINVVNLVAASAGWGRQLPEGSGLGVAVHRSFLTYVATVVEVNVSGGELTIPRVWMAIDAGTVVNTDTVINQCQGGAIFGLSCALHAGITMKHGAVEQSNYHDYAVARMNEAPPQIEVQVVASDALPAGVGEPPTPPFAPALCNAIFAATGKRIRQLPIADQLRS